MDVARPSLEGDGLGLPRDVPSDAFLTIDLVAQLVEVDDLELGAELDRALLRLKAAEQELEQRGFPGAVRPDDADLVTPPERGAEVADDRRAVVAEGDILCLDDFLAGGSALLQFDLRGAGALAALAPLGAQGLEGADASLVARAAGLHALTEPGFLLGQLFVKGGPLLLLGLEGGALPLQIGVVVAGPAGEMSAVQLDDPGGELAEEGAIVRHEEERGPHLEQEALQPKDRLEVEVVGRLIEKEDVRLTDEGSGQKDTALQTTRKALKLLFGGEVHFLHEVLDADIGLPVLLGPADAKSGVNDLIDRSLDPLGDFLGKAGEDDAVRLGDLPLLRFFLTGDDAHDAGLAGAVASHETDPLARIDLEVDLIKQGSVGVAEGDVAELEKGHGCGKEKR